MEAGGPEEGVNGAGSPSRPDAVPERPLAPGQATDAEIAELDARDDLMDVIPEEDEETRDDMTIELMLEAAAEMQARGEPLVDPVTGEPRIPQEVLRLLREL